MSLFGSNAAKLFSLRAALCQFLLQERSKMVRCGEGHEVPMGDIVPQQTASLFDHLIRAPD